MIDEVHRRYFLGERILFHSNHPGISVDAYANVLYANIWEKMSGKVRVYLDTLHWIALRDVRLGRSQHHDDASIYEALFHLVQCDKIVCPVSFPIIGELAKQSDKTTRNTTASLMDELSGSICILGPLEISIQEFRKFIAVEILDLPNDSDVSHLIWRKPFFMHGDVPPTRLSDDPTAANAINKAWLDVLHADNIQSIIGMMESRGALGSIEPMEKIEDINYLKDNLLKQNISKPQVFKAQKIVPTPPPPPRGPRPVERLRKIYPERAELNSPKIINDVKHLLLAKLDDDRWKRRLPCLYVRSILQTEMQTGLTRIIKNNDVWDILHASIALPYADVFLSERSLTHLIRSKPLELDTFYATKVVAKRGDILSWLHSF